tara:strand:- start:64 stop:216 length:153 start_codon:yes stop_codon:yes gene_type:complete
LRDRSGIVLGFGAFFSIFTTILVKVSRRARGHARARDNAHGALRIGPRPI